MFNMLGVIHHGHGRFTQAQEMFEHALQINPNYTEAALNLAVTYNDLGKYARPTRCTRTRSRARARSRAQLDPFARGKIANMHARVADAYAGVGHERRGGARISQGARAVPDVRRHPHQAGVDAARHGRQGSGGAEYQLVKQQAPKYLPARVNLGVTLYSLGRRDEAKSEWESVLREDPANKSCRMYLDILKGVMTRRAYYFECATTRPAATSAALLSVASMRVSASSSRAKKLMR